MLTLVLDAASFGCCKETSTCPSMVEFRLAGACGACPSSKYIGPLLIGEILGSVERDCACSDSARTWYFEGSLASPGKTTSILAI